MAFDTTPLMESAMETLTLIARLDALEAHMQGLPPLWHQTPKGREARQFLVSARATLNEQLDTTRDAISTVLAASALTEALAEFAATLRGGNG